MIVELIVGSIVATVAIQCIGALIVYLQDKKKKVHPS